jgi:hypothetical protein
LLIAGANIDAVGDFVGTPLRLAASNNAAIQNPCSWNVHIGVTKIKIAARKEWAQVLLVIDDQI